MYVTHWKFTCCLDSVRESKQKSHFLAGFCPSEKACGHYRALLDIPFSSQYLISQAAVSDNGVQVCVCVWVCVRVCVCVRVRMCGRGGCGLS